MIRRLLMTADAVGGAFTYALELAHVTSTATDTPPARSRRRGWWWATRASGRGGRQCTPSRRVRAGLAAAELVIAPTQWMLDELQRQYGQLPRTAVIPSASNPHVFVQAEADWLARAGIYALPARYEPFGLSVLEAEPAGRPGAAGARAGPAPLADQTGGGLRGRLRRPRPLASIGYSAKTRTLEIEFLNGRTYQYFEVAVESHEALMNAPAVGTHVNERIKEAYSYLQV